MGISADKFHKGKPAADQAHSANQSDRGHIGELVGQTGLGGRAAVAGDAADLPAAQLSDEAQRQFDNVRQPVEKVCLPADFFAYME